MTYSSLKKRLYFLSIISLLLTNLAAQVAFQETSFSNAQLIIQEEQLPYIIYFYGEWCPACQMMEEMTFKNSKVKELSLIHISEPTRLRRYRMPSSA